jgi:hypothetical protein
MTAQQPLELDVASVVEVASPLAPAPAGLAAWGSGLVASGDPVMVVDDPVCPDAPAPEGFAADGSVPSPPSSDGATVVVGSSTPLAPRPAGLAASHAVVEVPEPEAPSDEPHAATNGLRVRAAAARRAGRREVSTRRRYPGRRGGSPDV